MGVAAFCLSQLLIVHSLSRVPRATGDPDAPVRQGKIKINNKCKYALGKGNISLKYQLFIIIVIAVVIIILALGIGERVCMDHR